VTQTNQPEPAVSLALSSRLCSVPQARHHATAQLACWGLPPGLADDAALITTELVTNAIVHAPGGRAVTITLALQLHDGWLRIEVTGPDGGDVPAVTTMPGPDAIGGRGLPIVDALAASKGSCPAGGQLAVWADIPLTTTAKERAA
jgi:anti-sigma regulatory factor (Ser/Thr protein kinase)